jgi:two-component system response regulator HupR/HoxA
MSLHSAKAASIGFAKANAQFTIRAMSAPDLQPAAPGGVTPAKLPAILVVDDEPPLLDMFVQALSPYFEVVTAKNVREAEFQLYKRSFKVVVADHLMPGGNGMSFLVRAREEYPNMQRVLVTGYMKPEMLLRSVNEAALFRYLLKPVVISELIKVVQDAAKIHDEVVSAH